MLNNGKRGWTAIVLLFIGASSYGILSPLIKIAYNAGLSVDQITASQVTMGTAVLWLIVLARPKSWSNPFQGPWLKLAFIGIFGLSMTTIFYNNSLTYMSASLSIIVLFQFVWITLMMDSIVNRRWPNRYQWTSVAAVLIGTVLAVGLSAEKFHSLNYKGILFGLISALAYSLFIWMTGRLRTKMDSVLKSAVMLTSSLPLIYIMYPPHFLIEQGAGTIIWWGVILGCMGQVLPTITFNIGVPRIGSSLSAMIGSIELPAAIISAMILLGEKVNGLQWIGMLLILTGVVIAQKKTGPASKNIAVR